MRGWWEEFAGLVLPTECAGCGLPRTPVCGRCRAVLGAAVPRRVWPDPLPAGLPAVCAVAPYADAVRSLLLAHKERGALTLAGVLGAALASAVRHGWPAPDAGRGPGEVVLVPVPSTRRAVRERGHDPVLRIARSAAGRLRAGGVPVRLAPVLRLRRAVRDQAGLHARERYANLAGALEVRPGAAGLLRPGRGVAPSALVLVDDLLTTGATISEAARALRAADVEGVLTRVRTAKDVGATKSGAVFAQGPAWTAGQRITAAVVACSPSSFEINRN